MSVLNFLVSITCFFLFLFSIHLFLAKSENRIQNRLLSLLLFTRSGHILVSLLMGTNQQKLSFILFQSFTPLYFAAPACFYLYITGFLKKDRSLKKTDWIHFIPAFLALVHVFPWPGSTNLDWQLLIKQFNEYGYWSISTRSGLLPPYFHSGFRTLLTITYLILAWGAVVKSKILLKVADNNSERNWMLFILKVATFFQLMGLSRIVLSSLNIPLYNPIFIFLNCIALLVVLLYALHKPQIFYGALMVAIDWKRNLTLGHERPLLPPETAEEMRKNKAAFPDNDTRILPISFKRIRITDAQLEAYVGLLKNAMESDYLFLNADLQIIDLASKTNIPVHHCSFVINNHLGKNFRDWINGYRVNHFLDRYPLMKAKMTILAIAQNAGFKNQATFYNAFKKEKGVMPTVYISQELSA